VSAHGPDCPEYSFPDRVAPLAHVTPRDIERELRQFAEAIARAGDTWRQIRAAAQAAAPRIQSSLQLTGWILQQIEDAERNPDHPKAKPWLALRSLTPRQIAEEVIPHLAWLLKGDLTIPGPRGRKSGATDETAVLVKRLAKRIKKTKERPTTAAKNLLLEDGFTGDVKNRADVLVKAFRKQRF
jgi:hypothetical protein